MDSYDDEHQRDERKGKKRSGRAGDGKGKQGAKAEEIKCYFSYWFRVLCFEYKLVSIPYFLDEMGYIELECIYDHVPYSDRPIWDTSRILSLYIIAPYMKKKMDIQDMFPLPWDAERPSDDEDDILAHTKAMQELAKKL